MPIYEYECANCGKIEEVMQKISESPLTTCKHCSGNLQKLISHSSFHLKGSGWYVTDYAKKSGCTQTTGSPKKEEKASTEKTETTSKSTTETS